MSTMKTKTDRLSFPLTPDHQQCLTEDQLDVEEVRAEAETGMCWKGDRRSLEVWQNRAKVKDAKVRWVGVAGKVQSLVGR